MVERDTSFLSRMSGFGKNRKVQLMGFGSIVAILGILIFALSDFGSSGGGMVQVMITGQVKDPDSGPIRDVVITVDGYDIEVRTKSGGRFQFVLKGAVSGEVITLRTYHTDYYSFSTDRRIESDTAEFLITLKKRKR